MSSAFSSYRVFWATIQKPAECKAAKLKLRLFYVVLLKSLRFNISMHFFSTKMIQRSRVNISMGMVPTDVFLLKACVVASPVGAFVNRKVLWLCSAAAPFSMWRKTASLTFGVSKEPKTSQQKHQIHWNNKIKHWLNNLSKKSPKFIPPQQKSVIFFQPFKVIPASKDPTVAPFATSSLGYCLSEKKFPPKCSIFFQELSLNAKFKVRSSSLPPEPGWGSKFFFSLEGVFGDK